MNKENNIKYSKKTYTDNKWSKQYKIKIGKNNK